MRFTRFDEIIRDNAQELDGPFEPFGDDADLARFLVFEGCPDDTYYQYTSLFHSERLSPNDNRLLIRIRRHRNPEPGFLAGLTGDGPAGVPLARNDMGQFLALENEGEVDDDARDALLAADISDGDRLKVIRSMDLNLLASVPSRAAVMARTGSSVDEFGVDARWRSSDIPTAAGADRVVQHAPGVARRRTGPGRFALPASSDPRHTAGIRGAEDRGDRDEPPVRDVAEGPRLHLLLQGGMFDGDIRINLFRK